MPPRLVGAPCVTPGHPLAFGQSQYWAGITSWMAVILAFREFQPELRGHFVLVRSDNMIVVAYINYQGGLRSCLLIRLARCLLL